MPLRLALPKLMFISLDRRWTNEERTKYLYLRSREEALEYFISLTEKIFGDSRLKWSLYFLINRRDFSGIEVLLTRKSSHEKWLQILNGAKQSGIKL